MSETDGLDEPDFTLIVISKNIRILLYFLYSVGNWYELHIIVFQVIGYVSAAGNLRGRQQRCGVPTITATNAI